ncbi:MAG: DUF5752 family protein [Candidatus Binatia bacterium]
MSTASSTSGGGTPFEFRSSLSLTLVVNRHARDVAELLHHLREVSGSALYYHTHQFLVQHQYLSPEPRNDFAYWVTNVLGEDRLGEQLAAVDIIQFRSIGGLRERLIQIMESFLEGSSRLRTAPDGEEFHFREAATFVVPTGYMARDLVEFADCMERIGFGSLSFHLFDARLRLERGDNDFSEWLKLALGEVALAEAIARLDPYTYTMDGLRNEIVRLVRRRVEENQRRASEAGR